MGSTSTRRPASYESRELDPLRERPLYLRSLRAVLGVTIVIYAALLPHGLRTSLFRIVLLSVGYLLVTYGVEALSRWLTGGFYRWLFWLALGVDGAYLASATFLSGGSTGPVRYLVLVYLTVITLLGSWQTGLATAVWQSVAQLAFFLAQRADWLAGFGGTAIGSRLLLKVPEHVFRIGFKIILSIVALDIIRNALF